jgi:predicted Zn-dependent protease
MSVQELVEAALAASTADGCIVIAHEHTETNLRFANNSLTTNGQMTSRSMSVISTVDGGSGTSVGVVTRCVTTPDEVAALVRDSSRAALASQPADDVLPLIEPANITATAGDSRYSDDPAHTSVAVFKEFAPDLGAAFARARSSDQLLFGFAEHQLTSTFLATSTGLRRRHDQPNGRLELNGKSGDLSRSAWVGAHTTDFADIDVTALVGQLDTRLEWSATQLSLPAGRYETILPPCAVADLLINMYWTGSAREAEEGRSVFSSSDGVTRIGERLTSLPLTMRSDPNYPGLECAPFEVVTTSAAGTQSVFDNGADVHSTDWVADGVLTNLARSRAWGHQTGQPPRHYIDNLIVDAGGTASIDEMVANTERGLLLTCLWYIREVDPQTLLLTGLTRDGVYLIENGAITGAVNNFRFNESPIDLLSRATEAGKAAHTLPREWNDYFARTVMPALRIPDFNMSTVSQAS